MDYSKYAIYKRPKKAKKRKKKLKSRIQAFAEGLEKNLPASEKWFREKYKDVFTRDSISLFNDKYNQVLGKTIPDVINQGYRYIIEIDGSIHDDPKVKFKDAKKDLFYASKGYRVFRVKAYDNDSYNIAIEAIKKIRESKPELTSTGKLKKIR